MLLDLQNDGGIVTITSDSWHNHGGCDTCDYGTMYTSDVCIEMTTGIITIEASASSDYPMNEATLMVIMLPNIDKIKAMTEMQFTIWLRDRLIEELGGSLDKFNFKAK